MRFATDINYQLSINYQGHNFHEHNYSRSTVSGQFLIFRIVYIDFRTKELFLKTNNKVVIIHHFRYLGLGMLFLEILPPILSYIQ